MIVSEAGVTEMGLIAALYRWIDQDMIINSRKIPQHKKTMIA